MQTKNPELEQLMEEHSLTAIKVSELIDVPYHTVTNWRRSKESAHSNLMPKSNMKLLKLLLQ
tara:strand:+ start:874 stop:1059 length:186 start_codon:yes stop_codon:yes gene_type:complete